jgi:acetyl esterase/lipase
MHISKEMIHPELRRTARFIRLVLPSYTLRKFLLFQKIIKILTFRHPRKLRYENKYITRPDGSRLRICVYAPVEPKQNVPGLLWLHGGGYALGAPEEDEIFIRRFIEASGCVVVSPDYRLSLTAPYPAALEDSYSALLWLKDHCKEYGIRENQIMVGGDSAGGGLAAAIALYARDRKEVALAYQIPLYPMIDDRMDTESAKDNDAPLWDSKSNDIAWRLYLGELFGKPDVPAYAAPARADDLSGLPPACSFVGSIEPFYDETVSYMNRLRDIGIPVQFKVFKGCFHGFDIACGRTNIGKEAVAFLMDSFKHAVEHYFAEQPK